MDIDSKWNEGLEKLQGESGIQILANDNKDVISQLIRAIKDVDCLPEDLSSPESLDEAWAVDHFATKLYELFCTGAGIAEGMMLGRQVEKAYNDIQDEKGNTRDMHDEAGVKKDQF